MGTIEIRDGASTRRIRVDGLAGVVQIDCAGEATTVVVPEDAEVDRDETADDDSGVTSFRGG